MTNIDFKDEQGQLSKLLFPPFQDIPDEYDIDLDFHMKNSYGVYVPKHNYALLVNIRETEVNFAGRFIIHGNDRHGENVRISFYENEGYLDFSTCKPGKTVVLCHPEKHFFLDRITGIRVENLNLVIVIVIVYGFYVIWVQNATTAKKMMRKTYVVVSAKFHIAQKPARGLIGLGTRNGVRAVLYIR